MRIKIEDKIYVMTTDVLKGTLTFLQMVGLKIYDEKISGPIEMGAEALARTELFSREKKEPDRKDYFRPPKRSSFVKHLAGVMKDDMLAQLDKVPEDATIEVKLNERGEICAIEFAKQDTGTSGGPLVARGDIG
jgi:hypothetical protein